MQGPDPPKFKSTASSLHLLICASLKLAGALEAKARINNVQALPPAPWDGSPNKCPQIQASRNKRRKKLHIQIED